ncbi:hypothetical protein VE03_04789 [Pseudogymnoascus sp. 23342-1-I1]|nr:hypothetical protein VE03_04789 [Pseudogymnoascus sp. 23342-1-I1]
MHNYTDHNDYNDQRPHEPSASPVSSPSLSPHPAPHKFTQSWPRSTSTVLSTSVMTELDWMHFTAPQTRRKRAELVCTACHSKKTKCDLQNRTNTGHHNCTSCSNQNRECCIRPTRREKRQRTPARVTEPLATSNIMQTPESIRHSHSLTQQVETSTHISSPNIGARNRPSPTAISNSAAKRFQDSIHQQQDQALPSFSDNFHQQQNDPLVRQANFPAAPQSQASNEHTETGEAHTGDVDTGFLQIYGFEHRREAESHALVSILEQKTVSEPLQLDLQQSFIETYFEYCYPFCPILCRETLQNELTRSPLLANALAAAASNIQPPLIPHEGSAAYYKTARTLFYDDEEADGMISLKAIALFYWWAPIGTTIVHRHSSWWWTSVLIRHAQQMNFHRERSDLYRRDNLDFSLRRRIWWTAFARERLTALCQSKPCIIDPDDCNISEPTLADFPDNPQDQAKGEIFIYWVRLCAIIGRIAKVLLRTSADEEASSPPFPFHLRQELIEWVHSLPPHLQLPISSARTENFNRNVHQLHLPYLTVITILHLKRSAHSLPQALPPAILAASCTARILRDILSRGSARFLMAITCWYSGTAFIALLQACHVDHLSKDANNDLDILVQTVKQLQTMWASANVLVDGFDRLRNQSNTTTTLATTVFKPRMSTNEHPLSPNDDLGSPIAPRISSAQVDKLGMGMPDEDNFDWMAFFPFVTSSTNGIAEKLLSERANGSATRGFPSPSNELFHENIMMQYQDLFDPFIHNYSWAAVPECGP